VNRANLKIVILGLSITSSWGNGHATTYRSLIKELCARGHDILFLERDVPWYAAHRDLPNPPYGRTELYNDLQSLKDGFTADVTGADLVIVGSYVPEGVAVGEWVTSETNGIAAFYDIDTPVTLAKLKQGDTEYLSTELIPRYHLYLSFTGGPTLTYLEKMYGSPGAKPLYCSFDPDIYYPKKREARWDLGYLGTYSKDRQPPLDCLMLDPARRNRQLRMVVAGSLYPDDIKWPSNVERIDHLPPARHRDFYCEQRFTLNITRADMIQAGYSPSVRLFEAAACATPIISDHWEGLDTLFEPGEEILISHSSEDTIRYLHDISEEERTKIGERARLRVLSGHTSAHRASELEEYAYSLLGK